MTAADILGGLIRVNLAAGAAILGVIVLRRLVRRPFGARLAYGLWLLPVLAGAAVLAPPRQVVIVREAAPVVGPALQVHIPIAARVQVPLGPVAAAPVQPIVAASPPAATVRLDPVMLLVGLWLAGAGAAALVMASLQQRFVSQARRGAVGPAVVGVIAPRIVTPRDFGERYSQGEQALVLAHEEAHIARQDSRLNGLCAAVQCLCWFNPLVHLAARLMRIDQELACDETVVTRFPAARRAYAEVLLKAQLAIVPLPLGCYWPSRARHPLLERVALLKLKVVSPARRWAGGAALTVLCASAGLAAWASQPADVRIRIASPALNARAAQLAPVQAVAAAVAEMSASDKSPAAAPVKIAAGDGAADQTPATAAEPQRRDYAGATGPIDVVADQLERYDQQHRATWRGHVETVFGGNHLLSDVLNVYFSDKPSAAGPAALQKLVAEGHVTFVTADKTMRADQAVYDPTTGTVLLTSNGAPGGKDVGAEKLLIELRADHAAAPPLPAAAAAGQKPSPATEASVRRWIASLQANQPDDEDMSPALAQAARQQLPMTAQIFRAFGALKDVRFVRVTPEGDDAYQADFAHGKIRVMAAPLGPDGKLVRLAWGPIWDQDVRGDAVRQATPWATGVEPPLYRLGTAAPSAPVQPMPSATPVAVVTSPAEAGKQSFRFVQAYAASTPKLDQIARWDDPLCVQIIGLVPDKAAEVRARIEAVAKGVGQRMLAPGCTPNIEIVFTDKPQGVLDNIAARRDFLLGYGHRDAKTLKTVTRPIQAWYVTATVGGGGPDAGVERVMDDPDNLPPIGCGSSRFSACFASVFDNVLVVVDTGRVRDKSGSVVSDYVAMLALSQPRSLDGCNALPSVTDLFAPACPGRAAPDGLTSVDAAYLTSLYATDPQAKKAGRQSDIALRMARMLTAANMVAR